MASGGEVDELFDIKNAFYTGNFQGCINEAQRLKPSDPDLATERDVFMYRAYLALQKFVIVKDEIGANSPQLIQPLKTLANYLQNVKDRDRISTELEQKLISGTGNVDASNTTLLIVAATIFCHEANYEAALRVLHSAPSDHLECTALRLQTLLKMDRLDLAKKELKTMQEKDDDATLTQLAQAWVNMAIGGEKIQDAYYIYQELIDKHGSTPTLLNGQASSFLGQAKYDEAEAALLEAIDKDPRNADTLINLIVFSQHTGKPQEVCNRYLTQLKDDHASHPFVKSYVAKENDFNRMVLQYAV